MALTRNVIFIAFVLLVLVSITTQKKNTRQARCNRLLKNLKRLSCERETTGTFKNVYFWSRHNKTLTCKRLSHMK